MLPKHPFDVVPIVANGVWCKGSFHAGGRGGGGGISAGST